LLVRALAGLLAASSSVLARLYDAARFAVCELIAFSNEALALSWSFDWRTMPR
jgi:hypothetical protein